MTDWPLASVMIRLQFLEKPQNQWREDLCPWRSRPGVTVAYSIYNIVYIIWGNGRVETKLMQFLLPSCFTSQNHVEVRRLPHEKVFHRHCWIP